MKFFELLLMQLIVGIALLASSELAQAKDLTKKEKAKYRYIIQQELMYPRPCRLLLPPQVGKVKEGADRYIWNLVKLLAKHGILVVQQGKDENIDIYPGPNTSDVVQAHVNLSYDITNINLILGKYKITVENVEEKDGLFYVHGYRHVKGKTRIFREVIEGLPQEMIKAYTKLPMTWKITHNIDDSYEVEEIGVPD